jgi:hypothetical protein
VTRQEVPALIAAVMTAACALLEPRPWRADPQSSSVVHVRSEIRFPVRAGDFSLVDWEERGAPRLLRSRPTGRRRGIRSSSSAFASGTTRTPSAIGWPRKEPPRAPATGIRRLPRREITLEIAIRDQQVDSTGSLVAGDATHSSEVWVTFRQKEYVALVVMLYAAESLSDQDAIERLGDVLDRISWLAPD